MNNKLLHALSNRAGPFQEPFFPTHPTFEPKVVGPEEQRLREDLMLHYTRSDYYLKVYISLLQSFPEFMQQFQDTQRTYNVQDWLPGGVTVQGGDFLSGLSVNSWFTDPKPDGFPFALQYWVDYVDEKTVRLTSVDLGIIRLTEVTLSDRDPNRLLRIQWPVGFPFVGILRADQTWEPGARIVINVEPSAFPYLLMVHRVKSHPLVTQWLAEFKLVDEFIGSPDPAEQLAIVLTMIALKNSSVFV